MTHKVQADGGGRGDITKDGVSNPGGDAKGSESSGGPYPGGEDRQKRRQGKFGAHGGQSRIGYHGTGQLGEDDVGDNPNAVTKD